MHALRDQKYVQFLILRNRTGSVQVVHKKTGALAERVSALTRESVVAISGRVVENPGVRLGGVEIQLAELSVVNVAESPLPLDPFSKVHRVLIIGWIGGISIFAFRAIG